MIKQDAVEFVQKFLSSNLKDVKLSSYRMIRNVLFVEVGKLKKQRATRKAAHYDQ
jgi:hypothetical protein